MASFNIKSTAIANRDATPKVLTDAFVSGGHVRESQGYAQAGSTTDAVGSTYRLCQVPSNARVTSVTMQNTAFGGSAAVNVGVYYPTFIPQGGQGFLASSLASTAISASLFASAASVVGAAGPTEIITQSGTMTIPFQELPLWQAAGLASDPGILLDIVVAVSTIIAAQGTVNLKVKYVE